MTTATNPIALRPSGDSLVDQIARAYVENEAGSVELAARYGSQRLAVLDAVRAAWPRGRRGHPSKLVMNAHDEAEITRRYQHGATIAQLARDFGVSAPTMLGYLRRLGAHLVRWHEGGTAATRGARAQREATIAARLQAQGEAATARQLARVAAALPVWRPLDD